MGDQREGGRKGGAGPESDDCAAALSSKHSSAQQIRSFIRGYKLQHPIGDEGDKFMRNFNGGIISLPYGRIFFFF